MKQDSTRLTIPVTIVGKCKIVGRFVFKKSLSRPQSSVINIIFMDDDGAVIPQCLDVREQETTGMGVIAVEVPAVREFQWESSCFETPIGCTNIVLESVLFAGSLKRLEGFEQRRVDGSSMFGSDLRVDEGCFYLVESVVEDVDSSVCEKSVVVRVRFFDRNRRLIPGRYFGCDASDKLGPFVYLSSRPKAASPAPSSARFRAPEGSSWLRLDVHRWRGGKGTVSVRNFNVRPECALAAQSSLWVPLGSEFSVIPISNFDIPGQACCYSIRVAMRTVCATFEHSVEFRNGSGHLMVSENENLDVSCVSFSVPQESGFVERDLIGVCRVPDGFETCFVRIRCTKGAAFVSTKVELTRVDALAWMRDVKRHDIVGSEDERILSFPVASEWSFSLVINGLLRSSIEDDVSYELFFSNEKLVTVPCSDLQVFTTDMSPVSKDKSIVGRLKITRRFPGGFLHLSGSIVAAPPPGSEMVHLKIRNRGKDGSVVFHVSHYAFESLLEMRLKADSISSFRRMEDHGLLNVGLGSKVLFEKFSSDEKVIRYVFSIAKKTGDDSLVRRLIRYVRCGNFTPSVRHITHLMSEELRELDCSWAPVQRMSRGSGKVRERAARLSVGHLFKTTLPYENSGGAIRCLNIVKFQKRLGFDPVVVSPLGFPRRSYTGQIVDCEEICGVPHFRICSVEPKDLKNVSLVLQAKSTATTAYQIFRSHGASLVQASSGYRGSDLALVGLSVSKMLSVPFVYEVRSFHEHTWRPMCDWVMKAERTSNRVLQEDRCMQEAHAVVTICETMRIELIKRGVPKEKVFVVPNSVDFGIFDVDRSRIGIDTKVDSKRSITIGYVSNVSKREGHIVMLEATRYLLDEGLDIRCLIVGDGPSMGEVKDKCRALNLENHVSIVGEVSHDDVAECYRKIDIFVIPRLADYASDFVTPMKPFEAMALGIPLVVSDRPALKEIVGDNERGLLFRAGDPGSLAAAIKRLADDPMLSRQISMAANDWVKNFRSWNESVKIYEEVYRYAMDRFCGENC